MPKKEITFSVSGVNLPRAGQFNWLEMSRNTFPNQTNERPRSQPENIKTSLRWYVLKKTGKQINIMGCIEFVITCYGIEIQN